MPYVDIVNMKKLNEKEKALRKAKTKKIIKIVADVIVYTFASIMVLGLLVGGCQAKKSKKVGAYYYGDDIYFSMRDINVHVGDSTHLYYYYDSNYQDTFIKYSDFVSSGLSTDGTYGRVVLNERITIDGQEYSQYVVYYADNTWYTSLFFPGVDEIIISTHTTSGTTINRADLLTTLYNGQNTFKINTTNTQNVAWYRLLVWYFGDKGFNRITFTWDVGIRNYLYTFVDSDDTENIRYNGLMFKNQNFLYPSNYTSPSLTTSVVVLNGSFRSGSDFYTSIIFNFTSFYGSDENGELYYYYLDSGSNSPTFASNDSFLKGWFFLDSIVYSNSSRRTTVWRNATFTSGSTGGSGEPPTNVYFNRYGWVGDSYESVSPYRELYFYNVYDALSFYPLTDFGFYTDFSSAMFLNYWGVLIGHDNNTSGGVPDNTTPVVNVFTIMGTALGGLMPLFTYSLIPGFTIGTLLAIPFTVTIFLFVIKLFKR